MRYTEVRLKIIRWFRKYRRLILILFLAWFTIFIINYFMTNKKVELTPTTTYEPHTSVVDSSSTVPRTIQDTIEGMIEEYVGYCNEGNYQKAFNMLSSECKEYEYDNSVEKLMSHVLVKMPTPKDYSIQNYSNTKCDEKTIYIYEIKYTDNLLATGLTDSAYSYTSEKMAFYKEDDEIKMNVGDYIYQADIKRISENEYLKINVADKIVNYSSEIYTVKFTNRSNYTIVISDGIEEEEVSLVLPNETRKKGGLEDIVLLPEETMTYKFEFPKFVDDGEVAQSLLFGSIRVMEKYSGVDEEIVPRATIQSEIDNAISKFSMTIKL